MDQVTNRTIAILDILGFTNLIESKKFTLKHIYKILLQSEEFIRNCQRYYSAEEFFFDFSTDSIIITSLSDTKAGCDLVIQVAKQTMQQLITVQLPVRGAIAFGEIYINPDGRRFVAEGYIKAHKLEAIQEWIGLALDKSIENNFPDLISDLEKKYEAFGISSPNIVYYPVPIKNSLPGEYITQNMYAVNWCHGIDNISMLDQINAMEKISKDISKNTTDIRLSKKYQNSRDFITYIESLNEITLSTRNAQHFSIIVEK